MTDGQKTGYKYSIKFNQSLSTGMIAFEGYLAFDTKEEYSNIRGSLLRMLKDQQTIFTNDGFKCASIIPNNLKQLANEKSSDASSRKLGVKQEDKEKATHIKNGEVEVK